MSTIDYNVSKQLLEKCFAEAEQLYLRQSPPNIKPSIAAAYDRVFESKTQAYREALLGCIIATLSDPTVNLSLPYVNLGEHAYNGRSLDENVINPFLRAQRIPCSTGPFLNCFRRSVPFQPSTRAGLRDRAGFDAFLAVLGYLEESGKATARKTLVYHLYRFVQLREASSVDLSRLLRISLAQCATLISHLSSIQSGGRFPLFLVVSTFQTIKTAFDLQWDISYQGINVSDRASGAGGDITITQDGQVVLAAEVTERTVDRSRVMATFDTKIAPNAIEDYLFFIKSIENASEALDQAKRYFSQGHEVNFLEITNWIVTVLSLLGTNGRGLFMQRMISLLDDVDVPASLKVAWNDALANIATGEA